MSQGYVLVTDSIGQWNVFEVRGFWRESNHGDYVGRNLVSLRSGLRIVPNEFWEGMTDSPKPRVVLARSPGVYEVEQRFVVKQVKTKEEALALIEQVEMLAAELDKAQEIFRVAMRMLYVPIEK